MANSQKIATEKLCFSYSATGHNSYPFKAWESFDYLLRAIVKGIWSPGIFKNEHRLSENFLFSDLLVLDFDGGVRADDIANSLADTFHVIAPTKSHTIEHNRFRVIIPWERRIEDGETATYSTKHYINKFDSDPSCSDPARMYYPSKSITHINVGDDLFLAEVKTPPPKKEYVPRKTKDGKIRLSNPVMNFLFRGVLFKDSGRNDMCYWSARELLTAGKGEEYIIAALKRAVEFSDYNMRLIGRKPTIFKEKEYYNCLKSAKNKIQKRA
jgi:hypothetical protein